MTASPPTAWEHLSRVPDFRGIRRDELDRLVDWMLRDGSFVLAGGRLVLGPKAERRFGRRNFMELFAVFSSPQSYTVQTAAGQPLGTLNQAFVDRLVDGVSCFLLGGRRGPCSRYGTTTAGSSSARAPRQAAHLGRLHPAVPRLRPLPAILRRLSDARYMYLDDAAGRSSPSGAHPARESSAPERGRLEFADKEIRWWTFAGGRINSTLRYGLERSHSSGRSSRTTSSEDTRRGP